MQLFTWLPGIDTPSSSPRVGGHSHSEIIAQVASLSPTFFQKKDDRLLLNPFSGQLGMGHTNNVDRVSCIRSLKFGDTGEKVILAACGRESSLVATNQGSLYSFGSNSHCQLALESKDERSIHPEPVKIATAPQKRRWKQIAMGAEHTCALTNTGEVYVWGSNEDGQCGQDEKHQTIKRPQELRINVICESHVNTNSLSKAMIGSYLLF